MMGDGALVESVSGEEKVRELEELMRSFWRIAEKDFEASKLLYKHGLYPHAIFYAEQCAEKAAKASLILCLMREIQLRELLKKLENSSELREENSRPSTELSGVEYVGKVLREVGHDAIRLVRELCSCVERTLPLNIQALSHFFKPELIKRLEEKTKGISEACRPVASWSLEGFLQLSRDEQQLQEFIGMLKNIDKDAREVLNEVLSSLSTIRELSELLITISISIQSVKLAALFMTLSPHAVRSRYPEAGFNPLDEYIDGLPLIKHFDEMMRVVENAFAEVREIRNYQRRRRER